MKKAIILLAIAGGIWSCSDNKTSSSEKKADSTGTTTSATAPAMSDVSQNPDYKKGLALVGQSDCLTCHKVSEKVVGPAYQDVAARYAGKPGIEDTLANKVIKGGAGNWGQVPMTAHAALSHEDAVTMVKYILLLKQQP